MALVDVTAVLGMRSGQVEVTFDAEMTDVEVAIWGVDELRLTSPNTLVHLETASRGEKRSFPVDFVPGVGTNVLINGKPQFEQPIKEPEFFNALMKIWLGKNPADM